jgi:hypothetical protein
MGNSVMSALGETLYDQLFGFLCMFGAMCSLAGPILMNSIMYLCASSVSVENFDHFLVMSRPFLTVAETLTWSTCVGGMFCLSMLGLVLMTDHAELPEAWEILNSASVAWICFAAMIALFAFVVGHINILCAAVMHSGLLSSTRDSAVEVWAHEEANRATVVDSVVRRAIAHPEEEELMTYLNSIQGKPEEAEADVSDASGSHGFLARMKAAVLHHR